MSNLVACKLFMDNEIGMETVDNRAKNDVSSLDLLKQKVNAKYKNDTKLSDSKSSPTLSSTSESHVKSILRHSKSQFGSLFNPTGTPSSMQQELKTNESSAINVSTKLNNKNTTAVKRSYKSLATSTLEVSDVKKDRLFQILVIYFNKIEISTFT